MTDRFSLNLFLLRSVSHGAQDFLAFPRVMSFELNAGYGTAESGLTGLTNALSFLAWIKAWLCLLLGMDKDTLPPAPKAPDAPLNRRFARRRLNKAFAAGKMDRLVYHIYRRYGLKRCQQWLYNRKLIGRVRWCFWRSVKRWMRAAAMAAREGAGLMHSPCGAPLSPD